MEEWHLVFVGFVGAIKEEDGIVGGKEFDQGRMTEEESFEFTVIIYLGTRGEA